jgi:hypothetical protein
LAISAAASRIIADHVIDAALCGYEYSGLAKILNIPESEHFKLRRRPPMRFSQPLMSFPTWCGHHVYTTMCLRRRAARRDFEFGVGRRSHPIQSERRRSILPAFFRGGSRLRRSGHRRWPVPACLPAPWCWASFPPTASGDAPGDPDIAANDPPDHGTIATFRRRFLEKIEALFVRVLELVRVAAVLAHQRRVPSANRCNVSRLVEIRRLILSFGVFRESGGRSSPLARVNSLAGEEIVHFAERVKEGKMIWRRRCRVSRHASRQQWCPRNRAEVILAAVLFYLPAVFGCDVLHNLKICAR